MPAFSAKRATVSTIQRWVGSLRIVDDLRLGAPLGHRLADQQRDERAAEAHDGREAQQRAEVQAVGGEEAVETQQRAHVMPSTA
jgi:hypothetical protein